MSETISMLMQSKIFPAVEFSLIISLVIVSYYALHVSNFKTIKPAAKMTISMFLGTFCYMVGKLAVIAIFAVSMQPTAPTAYAF